MKLKITAKFTINCHHKQFAALRRDGSFVLGVFTILAHKKLSARYQVVSTSRSLHKIYHRLKIVICGCKRSQIDASLALKHQQGTGNTGHCRSPCRVPSTAPLPSVGKEKAQWMEGLGGTLLHMACQLAISEHIVMTYTH